MSIQKVKFYTDKSDLIYFMENLPDIFHNEGTTIKNDRNEIKIINYGGLELSIKAFNKVTVFNRFIYSWFRRSKAERSYHMARLLIEKGIDTPYPFGYVDVKGRLGILKTSYYVSLYQRYDFTLFDILKDEHPEAKKILSGFARFMATKVHPAGIWHRDLSPGNVLIIKNLSKNYSFSLVDLNRVKVKKRISSKRGISNLQKLTNRPIYLSFMAEEYAMSSNSNPTLFAYILIGNHLATFFVRRFVKRFLHIFKPKKKVN